ncbi:hypothetical protein BU15DRAFT_65551 [Melanogaster broomeanus]|nr:hypothetical protein BU15DRAFT_65551 [Melanogaster broomeanus]
MRKQTGAIQVNLSTTTWYRNVPLTVKLHSNRSSAFHALFSLSYAILTNGFFWFWLKTKTFVGYGYAVTRNAYLGGGDALGSRDMSLWMLHAGYEAKHCQTLSIIRNIDQSTHRVYGPQARYSLLSFDASWSLHNWAPAQGLLSKCLGAGHAIMPSTTLSKKSSKDPKPAKTSNREPKALSSAKPVNPEPDSASEAEDSGADADDYLYGFSTDDDDSSDDEAIVEEGIDVGKLPTVAKDDATVQKKLERANRQPKQDRGVISISRLPHGFYEDQLRAPDSRNIMRFLEFDSSSVAQIVAETMDNYLLMGHIMRCRVIPKEEVHPELWMGANRKWRPVPRDRISRLQHNKVTTMDYESIHRAEKRLMKRQRERKRKLEEAGIKYDFDAVAYKKKQKAIRHIKSLLHRPLGLPKLHKLRDAGSVNSSH